MPFGAVLVPLVTTLIGAAAVEVAGNASCPRPAEVASVLQRLTATGLGGAAPDVAEVSGEANQVVVSLRSAASGEVSRRQLPAQLSCAERAAAAAVIIAAWQARLAGPAAGGLPIPAPPADSAAATVATTAGAPADPVQVALAGGGFLSMNAAGVAVATSLEVGLARRHSTYGTAVGLLVVDAHSTLLGAGDAAWRRFGLTADLRRRLDGSSVWLEARAGVALTVLRLAGRSFAPNQDAMTFDPGGAVGLRLGIPARSFAPWLQVGAAFWPRGQVVTASGNSPASARLPRVEGLVGLGITFERAR